MEGVILKANLIPLEMNDFDVILGIDWLSNHRASMDFVSNKLGYLDLEFECDRRILPTCVILALEAKRLLHKRCETYLAHVIDKSLSEITLDSVLVVCEFL